MVGARQRRRHPVPRREERRSSGSRCCAASPTWDGAGVLTKRLIACFDVVDGRVTKAQQFQDNIDVAPAERARAAALRRPDRRDRLLRHQGERARSARSTSTPCDGSRDHVFVPFTVGGGIRDVDDMFEVLKAGAEKISVDSMAVRNPDIIRDGRRGVRAPVHRAQHPGEARRRPRRHPERLRGVHRRRPPRDRPRRARVGAAGRGPRRGRDRREQHRPRRHRRRATTSTSPARSPTR